MRSKILKLIDVRSRSTWWLGKQSRTILGALAQAYQDIANELGNFGFLRIQGSVYISDNDDLANLFRAIMALKRLPWFASSVRDIRAFKVEHWSDFTSVIKSSS